MHSSSLETSEKLPSSSTKRILEEWERLSEYLQGEGKFICLVHVTQVVSAIILSVEGDGPGGSRV